MQSNYFLHKFGYYNSAFSRSDAEQRAMKLRDALLTPRGSRGPQAPQLAPVHMARLFIALTAPKTAPTAAEIVIEYSKMKAIGEKWVSEAEDFETALTAIFSDIDRTHQVAEVKVCRSWPEASIILTDGRCFTFSTLYPPTHEKQSCRIDFAVSWHFFHDIMASLDAEKHPRIKTRADWDIRRECIVKMKKINDEQGPEAVQTWIKANPLKVDV